MKYTLIIPMALALAACSKSGGEAVDYTQYVDPFVGTAYVGHTHPAAVVPFGMVQAGPDTGYRADSWEHCSGYCDADSSIIGFSHTHLSGTGCPDMGDIMVMPVVGDTGFDHGTAEDTSTGYRSAFSHDSEEAAPGYYEVHLDDYDVKVEIAATERCAIHRYTFPKTDKAAVLLDLVHGIGDTTSVAEIEVVNDTTIQGFRRSRGFARDHVYYYYITLSKPMTGAVAYIGGKTTDAKKVKGTDPKLRMCFKTAAREQLTMRVALSTTGTEGARRNYEQEARGVDLDTAKARAHDLWQAALKSIDVTPMNEDQMSVFYTSLYHALIVPNLVTDVDNTYAYADGKPQNHNAPRYTNFSLWDTYRCTHPFYELVYPDKNSLFLQTVLDRYRYFGTVLPTNEYAQNETWCMIGNHSVSILADAYLKGLLPKEYEDVAAEAIYKSLTTSHPKSDFEMYDRYGYYPYDLMTVESVSRTLETSYNDYCAALVAARRGDKKQEAFFRARSQNFRHLFDPETGLMRAKDSKGRWIEPFDQFVLSHASTCGGHYTEGNAWQYTWHVQQDAPALVELMGSKERFRVKLDSLFFLDTKSISGGFNGDVTGMIGQYAHGNEPSHHVIYFYQYSDQPQKTAELIRQVFDQFYLPGRDGLSGNDDCGQMSTWYIFSALGFYPVDPASGEYIIGAPQVKAMTIHLQNGKTLTMKANNLSKTNKYVAAVRLNGKPLDGFKITYDQIKDGADIEFDMSQTPAKPAAK